MGTSMGGWEDHGPPWEESPAERVEHFSWDDAKAANNLEKHGVSFDEALTCWDQEADLEQRGNIVGGEPRWVRFGWSTAGRRLLVIYSRPKPGEIRIITARRSPRGRR